MKNRKRPIRNRHPLGTELLEHRIVLSVDPAQPALDPVLNQCVAIGSQDLQSIPFKITGGGHAPTGFPFIPGTTGPHTSTGEATQLGSHSGEGVFKLEGYNDTMTGGTFSSAEPVVFIAANGDQIAFHYGRTDFGAASLGEFTIIPTGDGDVIIQFVAEFTLVRELSTGRFEKYTEGSFIMIATTEPFAPVPDENGFSEPFDYTWDGEGTISFAKGPE